MAKKSIKPSEPERVRVSIEKLRESREGPRASLELGPLEELAGSMIRHGQIHPLTVSPAGPDGIYEVITGDRRLAAARMALARGFEGADRIEFLDCVVRSGCGPAERAVLQNVENSMREDLGIIEEGLALKKAVDAGVKVPDLALALGRSEKWLRTRLSLLELPDYYRDAVSSGDLPLRTALLGLLTPEGLREEFFEAISEDTGDNYRGEAFEKPRMFVTFASAQGALSHVLRRLESAEWDLSDATLVPEAGPCSKCPKRTDVQQALFEDLDPGTCLDPECFSAKRIAHVAAQFPGAKVLKVSEKLGEDGPAVDRYQAPPGFIVREAHLVDEKDKRKGESWKPLAEILPPGPGVESIVVVDPEYGSARAYLNKADAEAALEKDGRPKAAAELSSRGRGQQYSETPEERKKRLAEARKQREFEKALRAHYLEALPEAVAKLASGDGLSLWRWLVTLQSRRISGGTAADFARRRGLMGAKDDFDKWSYRLPEDWHGSLTEEELRTAFCELVLYRSFAHAYDRWDPKTVLGPGLPLDAGAEARKIKTKMRRKADAKKQPKKATKGKGKASRTPRKRSGPAAKEGKRDKASGARGKTGGAVRSRSKRD